MKITPTSADYRAAARLIVSLMDKEHDISAAEFLHIDDIDQACRTLVAAAQIGATSIVLASPHGDIAHLGLAIHKLTERYAETIDQK